MFRRVIARVRVIVNKTRFGAKLFVGVTFGCMILLPMSESIAAQSQSIAPLWYVYAPIGNVGYMNGSGNPIIPFVDWLNAIFSTGNPIPYWENPRCDPPVIQGGSLVGACHADVYDGTTNPPSTIDTPYQARCPYGYNLDVNNAICTYISGAILPGYNLGGPTPSSCNNLGNGSDPINDATGNNYRFETDYAGSGPFSLSFRRQYNSSTNVNPPDQPAIWRNNYERSIDLSSYNSGLYTAYVSRPDGAIYLFTLNNNIWTPDANITDKLVQLSDSSGNVTGWQYTNSNDEMELYDATGKLLSITARNGFTQTLTYSDGTAGPNGGYVLDASGNPTTTVLPAGLMIRVTDPAGRSLNFGYDASNRIVKMTDPADQVYLYSYDTNNNLTKVTYPDTHIRTYLYNEQTYTSNTNLPYALTGIIDENNTRYVTWGYDSIGNANSNFLAGNVASYSFVYTKYLYNAPATTTITDPLGTSRTYNYQTILGVAKNTGVSQPGGSGCSAAGSNLTYDGNGNVSSRTDFNGNETCYAYDLSRNLETTRVEGLPSGTDCTTALASTSFTAPARKITTTWDTNFRLPTEIDENGRKTVMNYDPTTGNLLTKTITDTATNESRTWTYTYTTTADGTLPGLIRIVDGPRTDVVDITTYGYYANGDLKTITNALNHTTQITQYDPDGRPQTIIDPNGLTTSLTYTPRGWLESRTVGEPGIGVEITRYDYYPTGLLQKVTLPDLSTITYTYDDAHRLTDIYDTLGNHIHYKLDAIGNRTEELTYDVNNVLTQAHGHTFDALNRLWQDLSDYNAQTDTFNTTNTTYGYDPNGNLTTVTDLVNAQTSTTRTTINQYDALNRLFQVTDALTGVTKYGYDDLDQLRTVTDPRSLVTSYGVNALGDQKQLISPDTGTTNRIFDSAGNLKTATDARNMVTTYGYDALNRVTSITFTSGVGISFLYDAGSFAFGKVVQMTDETGTTTWGYDAHERVYTKNQVIGTTNLGLIYGYNGADQISYIVYPSHNTVTYGFDAQGRINSIIVNGLLVLSNVQYQPFGAAKSWLWGNNATYSRSFDLNGRMSSYPLDTATRTLQYDAANRITNFTDPTNAANDQGFGYDTLDRLTSWTANSTNQSYGYDADGNRTSITIGATQYAYAYPTTSNQLASVAGPTAKSYTYDGAGNITNDGTYAYTYNARGRLSQVDWGRNKSVMYGINGLGQRLIKTVTGLRGTTTLFAYDEQGHLIGEYDSTGVPIEETIYLYDTPVAVVNATGIYYIQSDQLNTPRVIINSTNTPVWRWDADPFGNNVPNDNPSGLGTFTYNLRFPGQYYDAETGLNYNYFRDYDSGTGRYIESDPIGLGGGLNIFTYAYSNPLVWLDPTGMYCIFNGGNIIKSSATPITRKMIYKQWKQLLAFPVPQPSVPAPPEMFPAPSIGLQWQVNIHQSGYIERLYKTTLGGIWRCYDECGKLYFEGWGTKDGPDQWQRETPFEDVIPGPIYAGGGPSPGDLPPLGSTPLKFR